MDIFERGDIGSEHKHIEQLYRFTDRLWRAETPNNVYEAALDTVTCALGCSRAAILLLEDTGFMRFASARGLSDSYRGGLEGHSPWPRNVKDPRPVCIQDVEAANLPETLKTALRAEQIKALAFIPLLANGVLVGMLVTYYDACHVFSKTGVALAVVIARQLETNLERKRVEEVSRTTQRQLEAELAAARQLQKISSQLILASNVQVLYEEILDAAVTIMGSDFASMQMFHPERGELELLAHRGFDPSSVAFWQWVRPGAGCICGAALRSGERAVVSDVECCDFMAGTEDLAAYREAGMRAMQSTPLVSRTGRLLGMISTHWRNPYQPTKHDLHHLDVLARQAADLIERQQTALIDQRLATIVESSDDAIISKDLNGIIASWNKGAERIFGFSPEEMIGKPILVLIPSDRQHEELTILQRIRSGERLDHYETVRQRKDGSLVDISLTVSPLRDAGGVIVGACKIARDISARKREEEHQRALKAELDHRVKNVLATVSAIIDQTRAASSKYSDFIVGLDRRIRSLANTHDLLSRARWDGVALAEIVQREFAPYGHGNSEVSGPSATLKAEAAQAVAMVLHELTTNAAKYGAFSKRSGRVLLKWWRQQNGGEPRLVIEWKEVGGPPVEEPSRSGYGTSVVRELIPFELGGAVDLEFAKDGLRCRLEIPGQWVSSGPSPGDARPEVHTP